MGLDYVAAGGAIARGCAAEYAGTSLTGRNVTPKYLQLLGDNGSFEDLWTLRSSEAHPPSPRLGTPDRRGGQRGPAGAQSMVRFRGLCLCRLTCRAGTPTLTLMARRADPLRLYAAHRAGMTMRLQAGASVHRRLGRNLDSGGRSVAYPQPGGRRRRACPQNLVTWTAPSHW